MSLCSVLMVYRTNMKVNIIASAFSKDVSHAENIVPSSFSLPETNEFLVVQILNSFQSSTC